MSKKTIRVEEDLDFDFEKFQWNKYQLNDGTLLRVIHMPQKVSRVREKNPMGEPNYIVFGNNIVSAIVQKELRDKPSNEVFDPSKAKRIEAVPIEEPWNEILLADQTRIRFRIIVNQVVVSDQRNQFGEPIYSIKSSVNYDPIVPDYLKD